MRNFGRDNKRPGGGRFGGNKSFGGGGRFGGRDGGRPTMHQATCSECGQPCEVPFKPTGDRPIYCSNCFGKQDGGGSRPNRFGSDRHDKQMYSATCDKCGQSCQVPFRPTAGKPIYCDNCFSKGSNEPKDSGEVMRELKMLHNKIDQLIKILTPKSPVEKIEPAKVLKEAKSKKVVKTKVKAKATPKKMAAKKKK